MWIFTRYGFFSVVACKVGNKTNGATDPTRVMVRARRRSHLECLLVEFKIRGRKIVHTGQADYRYRVELPTDEWFALANELAEEPTLYTNFKSAADAGPLPPNERDEYHHLLHKVWGACFDHQHSEGGGDDDEQRPQGGRRVGRGPWVK